MRAGQVVRIRVNPKDCMSVLDVLQKAGVNTKGMSFSAAASLAFSSTMETFRQRGVIPDRDGFEYAKLMEPYLRTSQASKLAFANSIHAMGSEFSIAPVQFSQPNVSEASHASIPQHDLRNEPLEMRLARRELTELCAKKELSETGGIVWQKSDQAEFDRLCRIVYPEDYQS